MLNASSPHVEPDLQRHDSAMILVTQQQEDKLDVICFS